MARENNAARLKRELLARVARLCLEGRLVEGIDVLPFELTSEDWETISCCIHHDRALLRLRLLAVLGFPVLGMDDVDGPLRLYAEKTLAGREPRGFPLTMATEACNACAKSQYYVTNACQGCLARPCKTGCPRQAISVGEEGARIDPEACANCGLCEKACPFKAIVHLPVPCEEACPVGAIKKGEDGRATIDEEKCILCGKCLQACPFGAPMELSSISSVASSLRRGEELVALVAPAAMAQFPFPPEKLISALGRLGFAGVVEVAEGADLTAAEEAEELLEGLGRGDRLLATSCCPAWVRAAKALPSIPLSTTPSPMAFAARLARERYPDAKLVFIGPCLAKRWEAAKTGIDAVLSSEELGSLLLAADIQVNEGPDQALGAATASGRGFGSSGGVAAAIGEILSSRGEGVSAQVRQEVVAGLSRESLKTLSVLAPQGEGITLLEVMACPEGCVGGPCGLAPPKAAKALLDRYRLAGRPRRPDLARRGPRG